MEGALEKRNPVTDWGSASSNWKIWHRKFAEQSIEATKLTIRLGGIHEDTQSVLDLASGSGEPSIPIAKVIGPTGRIVATDVIATMVSTAKENSEHFHLSNMEFGVLSAGHIPFADQIFDVVTCRFGLTFFPDPGKAMNEVWRVLKPGGRAVLICWGPVDRNPRFQTTTSIVMKYSRPSPQATTQTGKNGGLFQFAEPGTLLSLMQGAKFQEIEERWYEIPWIWHGTVEEAWRSFSEMSAPFQKLFRQLNPDAQDTVSEEIKDAISKYYDGINVNFTATVNTVVASK